MNPGVGLAMRLFMGGSGASGAMEDYAGLYLDTKLIFAGILLIAILGISFDTILRRMQCALDPRGQAGQQ